MKVVHVSTYDLQGGAARAAERLHRGLLRIGVESTMLVQTKHSDDETVIGPETKIQKAFAKIRPTLDSLVLELYRRRQKTTYSTAMLLDRAVGRIDRINPDIVHLHWIAGGMIRIESLPRLRRPIVWTLHDMWAFTGGCHTPSECELFRYSCGKCPMLSSKRERDLSRTVWKRKHRAWRDLDVWIVTPSTWLAERAARAPILQDKRIVVIPNGLDTTRFKPVNKCAAREMLSVPHDRKIVLFGALNFGHDHNKGFHLLKDALEVFASSECGKHALLVLFGSSVSVDNRDAGIEVHNVGRLHDDISLSVLYAAADVTVVPSLHENLSNTIMESLGCGTPVVAFDSGGNADMIDHLKSGYLARPFSVDDLARGIEWVLSDRVRYDELCTRARDKVVKEFELTTIAKKYRDLYEAVLERKGQKERIVSL